MKKKKREKPMTAKMLILFTKEGKEILKNPVYAGMASVMADYLLQTIDEVIRLRKVIDFAATKVEEAEANLCRLMKKGRIEYQHKLFGGKRPERIDLTEKETRGS